MSSCFVPGCNETKGRNSSDKIFFKFPNDEERAKNWYSALGMPYSERRGGFVCENHFNLEEDLESYVRYKTLRQLGHRQRDCTLKANVVPHLHLGSPRIAKTVLKPKRSRSKFKLPEEPIMEVADAESVEINEDPLLIDIKAESLSIETPVSNDYDKAKRNITDEEIRITRKRQKDNKTKLKRKGKQMIEETKRISNDENMVRVSQENLQEGIEVTEETNCESNIQASHLWPILDIDVDDIVKNCIKKRKKAVKKDRQKARKGQKDPDIDNIVCGHVERISSDLPAQDNHTTDRIQEIYSKRQTISNMPAIVEKAKTQSQIEIKVKYNIETSCLETECVKSIEVKIEPDHLNAIDDIPAEPLELSSVTTKSNPRMKTKIPRKPIIEEMELISDDEITVTHQNSQDTEVAEIIDPHKSNKASCVEPCFNMHVDDIVNKSVQKYIQEMASCKTPLKKK